MTFDPTIGAEIRKTRPAVVLSSDAVGKLPIKIIAPITEWKDQFSRNFWHIKIEPSSLNGLDKIGAVDVLQVRGVDTRRFVKKLGRTSADLLEEITTALAAITEYP